MGVDVKNSSPQQGNLSDSGVCEILAGLCREKQTGVLRTAGNGPEKSIYLQDGQIVFAASRDPDDRLGELLLTRGAITRGQLEKSSALVGPGKRLGTILVELGFLPAADLPRWVREQVKEIIYSLFSCTDGTYRFEPGPFPSSEAIPLKISSTEVFLSGLRRVEKWSLLRRGAGEIRIPYRLSAGHREVLREITFSEEEQELLSRLESRALTMEEAAVKSPLSTLRVYQLFYALRVVGLLTTSDPEPPPVTGSPVVPSRVAECKRPSPSAPAPPSSPVTAVQESDVGAKTVVLKLPLEREVGRETVPSSSPVLPVPPVGHGPAAGSNSSIGDAAPATTPAVSKDSSAPPPTPIAKVVVGKDASAPGPAPAATPAAGGKSAAPRPMAVSTPSPGSGASTPRPSPAAISAADAPRTRKKMEYRVIRLEAEKLDGNGTQTLEDLLRTWTQKGYQLAGVVPGASSRMFGGTPPTFLIFSRD